MGNEADIVLAGRVVPLAATGGDAHVVWLRGERIHAVGGVDLLHQARAAGARIIDVGERAILPGFIDVHAHMEVACRTRYTTVDCRAPGCASVGDVLEVFRENLDRGRETGWVIGQGNLFHDQKLREGRLPTREELDSVSTDVALALRSGGHLTTLNSRALELAGIDRDYSAPAHSVTGMPIVERGAGNEPTGVVKEMDNVLPFPALDEALLEQALEEGARDLFLANGVTTVGEISETTAGIECMDRLHQRGALGPRVDVYLWAPGTVSLDEACRWQERFAFATSSDRLRIKGVKLFADGGYSAASAYVKTEYVDQPGWYGKLALTHTHVGEALRRTADAGLQLAIHANGDRAQEEVCTAIEAVGGSPAGELRTRIEHAGNFVPEYPTTTEAWRRAGIIPVPQAVFLYTFGDFFPSYLGPYGTRGRFPFRTLLDDGWTFSASSDVWTGAEPDATNPLFGVWSAVKRQGFRGDIIDPEQAVTVEEALRMYTTHGAAALGEGDRKGSIEAGKLADLVVLDRDPRDVAVDELLQIGVDGVLVGGRIAYERDGRLTGTGVAAS
jgi:predicted amidohydrolase YtcJ